MRNALGGRVPKHYDLLIGGSWVPSSAPDSHPVPVTSPFDGQVLATVSSASLQDLDFAVQMAEKGAKIWGEMPAYERSDILLKAAELADERASEIGAILSRENGKTLSEAVGEASRSGDLIRLATYEGTQLYGQTLPLDANRGTGLEKVGFTLRQPVGIVAAITPFNYPALLVNHKIAPALAAGNAVILKPATATPLTAFALAQCFIDAGLPEGVLSVLTGSGADLGNAIARDPRIRKLSFTGSTKVGLSLAAVAGLKKLSLELGSSAPVVILPDADLDLAAQAVATGGYVNAGQVCISVQRVIVHHEVEEEFLDKLTPLVKSLKTGDPRAQSTQVGAMINEKEAQRVEKIVAKAVNGGAKILAGGEREGAVFEPTLLANVDPYSSIAQEEIFGPVVVVSTAKDVDEALSFADSTPYGLAAGIFTSDLSQSVRFMRQIQAGVVHINWTPLWRADLMPYGGFKDSGVGKEGPRSAVEEMTEIKTVILHAQPWK
ncbi:aldehyde dehydrogenase family protein [Rothia nasisuis]|uniref:aldehyde dehydrogenase family protein n=1 Tax=Rothia nasisuis TaxID=2109647 RepID=UPI0030148518